MTRVIWNDQSTFTVDGQKFFCDTRGPQQRVPSTPESFTIVKNRSFVDLYEQMRNDIAVDTIFELGIFQGGSAAFLMQYFRPKKFVAIEKSAARIEALDAYIQSNGLCDSARCCYDTDQGDREFLTDLAKEEFPSGIDLIVDDASHSYELTKKSFEIMFPHLSPGGLYIVEDWTWAHSPAAAKGEHPRDKFPALTNLLFELTMVIGSNPKAIKSIEIHPSMFIVKKGIESAAANYAIEDNFRIRPDWPFTKI